MADPAEQVKAETPKPAAQPKADEGPQTFTFHLPDGKSASITAPRGTTTDQAWGYLTQQHPEYGKSDLTDTQSTSYNPDDRYGMFEGKPDPLGFIAGVGQGVLSQAEGAVQHLTGGAVDPNWIPALQRRADENPAGRVGQYVGAAIPYALSGRWMPKTVEELGGAGGAIARTLFGVGQRSTLPAAIQPSPQGSDFFDYLKQWGIQTGEGTLAGEVMHGLGRVLGLHPERLKREDQKAAATNQAEAARFKSESQAAEDIRERNRLVGLTHQHAVADRDTAQAAIDRLNQRNMLVYDAERAQHAAAKTLQADMPRQAVRDILNDARGLIGLKPLEYNATREAAPQLLRQVGSELDRIYKRMSFDPNQGGWMRTAAQTQERINDLLRQSPDAQALWDRVFQGKAFMPGLRAGAGARPPVTGTAPATIRTPQGQTYRLRSGTPTGDVQGALGSRSGPVSGDQLSRMMSNLRSAQQEFGLQAQKGGGAIYGTIAEGLRDMRQSIETQLDSQYPTLSAHRKLANQAYFLTSRVMDAVDVQGVATPEQLLKSFRDAEGPVRFGTDRTYGPQKDRLRDQHRQHTISPDEPTPPQMIKPRPAIPALRMGTVPQVRPQAAPVVVDRGLPAGVGHGVAHLLRHGARVPYPAATAAGEAVRQLGGRGVERGLSAASRGARRATGGTAAGISRGASRNTDDEENQ